MKKMFKIVPAMVLILMFAVPALAKNTVNVKGDFPRDRQLTIDVDWTVDMAKYKGLTRDQVRQRVRQDIWKKMHPKLTSATKGYDVSYERCNFDILSERTDLMRTRSNGYNLYSLKMAIRFNAPNATYTQPTKTNTRETRQAMQQRWDTDI